MKKETKFVVFALVIVLSVGVVAATNQNIFHANGQLFSTYDAAAETPIFIVGFSDSGLQVHPLTGLLDMSVPGYHVYGADGVYFITNLATGVEHVEIVITNDLNVPITVTPTMQLFGADQGRAGTSPISQSSATFTGASFGCPASGPSVNPGSWLTPVLPSAADGTHDSTGVTMSFQVSTLNISNSSKATSNEPLVATSVRNQFLQLHPNETKTSPAANQVQLQNSLCTPTTKMGSVSFAATTVQPGQTTTVGSTANSTDWGFPCSPATHSLVNYNVQAGSSTYQALKTSQVIVFSPKESNICGT